MFTFVSIQAQRPDTLIAFLVSNIFLHLPVIFLSSLVWFSFLASWFVPRDQCIMNRVEQFSHRSWKGRRPWGALVPGPRKSARDHREEWAAPGRAGSPGKDRVRLETGRAGRWSCPVVHFLAHDDRQHGGDFMRLAPDTGCIQRWVILGLPVPLIVRWLANNAPDNFVLLKKIKINLADLLMRRINEYFSLLVL